MKKLLAVSFLSLLSLPVLASDWRGWEDFSIAGSNERHWICGMDNIKGSWPVAERIHQADRINAFYPV